MRQQKELVQLDANTLKGGTLDHSIDHFLKNQFTY